MLQKQFVERFAHLLTCWYSVQLLQASLLRIRSLSMRDSFVSSDVAHSSNQAPKPQHGFGYNIKHKASLAPEFQIQRSSKPKGHQFVICFSADCAGA